VRGDARSEGRLRLPGPTWAAGLEALRRPEIPNEAIYITPSVDSFLRTVELGIADGAFIMITGDPGTGKSVALRLLSERLRRLPDLMVGTVEHPQSRTSDFYCELGRQKRRPGESWHETR